MSNLTLAYGSVAVLQDIGFSMEREDIFIIMGVNGCGKNRLLKSMIGAFVRGTVILVVIGVTALGAGRFDFPYLHQLKY